MPVDIQLSDLTNGEVIDNVWVGTGIFDELIAAVNSNIEIQYNSNRLDGTKYADVYLGSMQSVISNSISFLLQEKQIEASIALQEKELELKELQKIVTERDIALKEKQIDVTEREMVEKELTGAKQRILLDEEKETADKQQLLLDTEEEIKQYEHDVLQLDQHNLSLEQINLAQQQKLTEIEQTRLVDANADAKEYEVSTILPEQYIKIQEEVDLLQSQDLEVIAGTARADKANEKDLEIKSTQKTLTERQVAQIEKDIDVKERSTVIAEENNAEDIALKKIQQVLTQRNIAQVEKDIEYKVSQTTYNTENTNKVIEETKAVTNEDNRRELMAVKDRAYKAAQTADTYRGAMLKEQQQSLLANQTAYEAAKTDTLEVNTKANMLIRTIDGGVSEAQGYLSTISSVPTTLTKVIAEARADLLALSGVDMDDYLASEATYSFTGTVPAGTTGHTSCIRNTDSYAITPSDGIVFYTGEIIEFTNTSTGDITKYKCLQKVYSAAASSVNFTITSNFVVVE